MVFIRIRKVDSSDGVAKESIRDIPAGFPNTLGGPERVLGARGAGRSLAVDAEATLERVVARKTASEKRGIVVESKLYRLDMSLRIKTSGITFSAAQKEYLNVLSIVHYH